MENNRVENEAAERRFAKRYEIKNVLVYIRYLKKINWFRRFCGPYILDDIAISSVRFIILSALSFRLSKRLRLQGI